MWMTLRPTLKVKVIGQRSRSRGQQSWSHASFNCMSCQSQRSHYPRSKVTWTKLKGHMGQEKPKVYDNGRWAHINVKLHFSIYGALGKKAFCRILKRWVISWITSQNVQRLQIFAISASFLKGDIKTSLFMSCKFKCDVGLPCILYGHQSRPNLVCLYSGQFYMRHLITAETFQIKYIYGLTYVLYHINKPKS